MAFHVARQELSIERKFEIVLLAESSQKEPKGGANESERTDLPIPVAFMAGSSRGLWGK
jgi:hypothetical protein